jgi:HAD superfamily hydrolase (TIGR01490 family)
MPTTGQQKQGVETGSRGPAATRTAAFFDMDHTVIVGNTGRIYLRDMRHRGELGRRDALRLAAVMVRYKLALVDMERVMRAVFKELAGTREDVLTERCRALYDREIAALVSPKALEVIEEHRSAGHRLVLLTAQTPYLAGPLAAFAHFDALLCTRLETKNGLFTGDVVGPICYGNGKRVLGTTWAAENGVHLESSYFYTDSYTDLPMLEAVGHPRVTNPDPRLWVTARRRGWPVEKFGRP